MTLRHVAPLLRKRPLYMTLVKHYKMFVVANSVLSVHVVKESCSSLLKGHTVPNVIYCIPDFLNPSHKVVYLTTNPFWFRQIRCASYRRLFNQVKHFTSHLRFKEHLLVEISHKGILDAAVTASVKIICHRVRLRCCGSVFDDKVALLAWTSC